MASMAGPLEELDVSVVLPVYNEAGHVGEEIERIRRTLDASGFSYEVIVVDDGSTDGTGEIVRQTRDIQLIQLPRNGGVGTARRFGTRAARGRVVVWTDADMSYPNDEIPRLVKELDGHDQVVGARTSEQGTRRFLRTPAKWLIRRLAIYLTRTSIPDLNSGLRAFRRDVAIQFLHRLPKGFSCVTTLTLAFLSHGYSIKYIPIDYRPRRGASKFHWWRDTKRYLTQVVRMVMSFEPLRVFMPVGLILTLVGLGKLGYDLVDKDFRVATNTLLVLFAALQAFSIGFVADLVVQVNAPRDLIDPARR